MKSQRTFFTTTHSVLAQDALAELVAQDYKLEHVKCWFLRRGLNDTYLISSSENQFILRVYSAHSRSIHDVTWELELLTYLEAKEVGFSKPIVRFDGLLFSTISAIEGDRVFAMFEFVAGRTPEVNLEDAGKYGLAAAKLHLAMDGFSSSERFELNLDHLITQPLALIKPWYEPDLASWTELLEIANRVKSKLELFKPFLEWAACHGDLHTWNARVNNQEQIVFFDFDCAGMGFRAYDLAVYWWAYATNGNENDDVWQHFRDSYLAHRALGEIDLEAVPWFVAARAVWFMGLYAERASEWGFNPIYDGFFKYGLDFLRRWERDKLGS